MCPGLFDNSPIEGHFGCFQFGATIHKAGLNNCAQVFVILKIASFFNIDYV